MNKKDLSLLDQELDLHIEKNETIYGQRERKLEHKVCAIITLL